jgi:hypothetical protein
MSDSSYASYAADLLPYNDTYEKQIIKEKQAPGKYSFTRYYSWSYNRPSSGGWSNVIVGYDYDLDTGERNPDYMYYFTSVTTITNGDSKTEVSVNDNMVVNSTTYMQYVKRAYFRKKTAELDMLISTRNYRIYMPGIKVKFYVDKSTMYVGVIRSARFIFGQFTRVKLVIDTDSTPVTLVHARFNYVYVQGQNSRALGHRDYYIEPDNYLTVYHPTFKSYVVDRWETFTPQTSSTTIRPTQETTTTINYNRAST